VRREIATLRHRAERRKCTVAFAHNDVHALNMIVEEKKDAFSLIDYEYAAHNYVGYELANHFNEYAGFGPIRWELLPTRERQETFIRDYLRSRLKFLRERRLAGEREREREGSKEAEQGGGGGGGGEGDFLQLKEAVQWLRNDVRMFFPASHLFWGLWAVVQGNSSDIDFDYESYASQRLGKVSEYTAVNP